MKTLRYIAPRLLGYHGAFAKECAKRVAKAHIAHTWGRFRARVVRLLTPRGMMEAADVTIDALIYAVKAIPTHFVGMSTVTGTAISTVFKWQVGNNLTGSVYSQITNTGTITKQYNFGTSAANNASGGGDEVFSFQQTISAASSITIDLNAMTNLLAQSAVALARIKGYQIRLLGLSDDSTISNQATSVTVTNSVPNSPSPLDFGSAGVSGQVSLTLVTSAVSVVALVATGTNYPPSTYLLCAPQATSGSGCVFAVSISPSGIPTSVVSVAGGTGYASGTVPFVPVGYYTLSNQQSSTTTSGQGGAHCHFDCTAAGFLPVSTTSRKITVFNNDPNNVATIELSALGATT